MTHHRSQVWRAGIILSRAYDWDGPTGWRLTVSLGYHRYVFGKDLH